MAKTTAAANAAAACHPALRSSSSPCPPWLQAALQDIEERVRSLAVSLPDEEEDAAHSFAERAENYYQKRPQLLALLQDLHLRYLHLADRYSQSLLKSHHHHLRPPIPSESDDDDAASAEISDAESALSFQPLPRDPDPDPDRAPAPDLDLDLVVAELVAASGSLVEVLESERMVLLGENARLGFRAAAAEEEAAAAAAELGWVRRRAAEMARAVVELREERRVCALGRRIEGLQARVYALERRNRAWCDAAAAAEKERAAERAEAERLRAENRRLAAAAARRGGGGAVGRWWERVTRMEWAPCVPHVKGGKGAGLVT
ncbi:LOW QUALITY PROTEIN: kinase-interacting family protein-like [Ananas comosus]|uniref:LOW QUALITY PROTEIN: kinase-interacting family protein-like n=1 Tax=Ananas comosus TaxID=4615 RepID=A0A6P5FNX0_ANACO|nr:LOW QUALITY PROTEIN: kinase-interacting family protein-like [Ananas comosus]